MKKLVIILFLLLFSTSFSYATVIQSGVADVSVSEMGANTYVSPAEWAIIAEIIGTPIAEAPYYGGRQEFYHEGYYNFGVVDVPQYDQDGLNIVLHNIYNSPEGSDNTLSLYLYDNESTLGLQTHYDGGLVGNPNWIGTFGATLLGTWIYTGNAADVVFSVSNPDLLALIHNGGTFGLGFDPDCVYTFDDITVETPVPEPGSLFLIGSGLLVFAGKRRKKAVK